MSGEDPIEIVREVAARAGMAPSRVVGPSQEARVVAVRRAAIRAIRSRRPDLTQRSIAQVFGVTPQAVAYHLGPGRRIEGTS